MTLIEAAKQAREALKEINKLSIGEHAICLPAEIDTAMDALDQAIAEAEQQEPVALAKELDGVIADVEEGDGFDDVCLDTVKYVRDQLAAAPKREWQGLTYEEAVQIIESFYGDEVDMLWSLEAKLKQKNGYAEEKNT